MHHYKFRDKKECIEFMDKRGWEYVGEMFHYGDIQIHISSAMLEMNNTVLLSLERNAIERAKWLKKKQTS